MVTVINLKKLFSGIKSSFRDLGDLMDPRKIDLFFAEMRLQEPMIIPLILWGLLSLFVCMIVPNFVSKDYMLLNALLVVFLVVTLWLGNFITDFLLVSGYFTFLGYFISGALGKTDNLTATKIGFLYYFTGIFLVVVMAYLIARFGGRDVRMDESFPIVAYAVIPSLLSGIFALSLVTFVLNYLAIVYSMILFYVAMRVRLGFEKSIKVMLLTLFLGGGISMFVFLSLTYLLGIPGWAW